MAPPLLLATTKSADIGNDMSANSASFVPNITGPISDEAILDPHRYDDIIFHGRPTSLTHPPMSLEARSAQFAPFATLSRYHEIIKSIDETAQNQIDVDRQNSLIDIDQPGYLEDLDV